VDHGAIHRSERRSPLLSLRRINYGQGDVFLLALFLGTVSGAGLYQLIAVMPTWFASPRTSFSGIGGKRDRAFWIPLQTTTLLMLAFALVAN
jgi:hypothetical protein